MHRAAALLASLLVGCTPVDPGVSGGSGGVPGDADGGDPTPGDIDPGDIDPGDVDPGDGDPYPSDAVVVTVELDGVPTANIRLVQGGTHRTWLTDAEGRAVVDLDLEVMGGAVVIASHHEARTRAVTYAPGGSTRLLIALTRYDIHDNDAYAFQDPGEPTRRATSAQCGHCHTSINDAWFLSPHRTSAKNPVVHDVFSGSASFANETACTTAGGTWSAGTAPGTTSAAERCHLGSGVLPDLHPGCVPGLDCESKATSHGGCADCHAPAIGGALAGHSLLSATGFAYDYGVSCDVCHKVESIDLSAAPGVGGRLRILRPSERSSSTSLGVWQPLTFGPHADVPNPRMGNVPRAHFKSAELCAGCHELNQAALVPGTSLDAARWPNGLPVHSTFSEWSASALAPNVPCQSCHMPPDPGALNGADLAPGAFTTGTAGGWPRPPGAVRRHAWYGPRQPASGMLQSAAALFVSKNVSGNELTTSVTVKNAGAGHALPTGEPMRSLVLAVEARCGTTSLIATGGDAVPDFGGFIARKNAGDDWSTWPRAQVGHRVRVVARPGGFYDYTGVGPFGDGRFNASQKGMPVETVVGEVEVTAVNAGVITTSAPIPAGDVAYLVDDGAQAGAAGFAFARVMVDAQGERLVPHHRAIDIASDNRLLPQSAWTSQHRFDTPCADPEVRAVLTYRAYPFTLARERGWTSSDVIIAEARR